MFFCSPFLGLMFQYPNVVQNSRRIMADHNTKAIAARVPMAEYIKVITAATDLKLSVSEYLIMKLNAPDRFAIQAELTATKSELAYARDELDKIQKYNLNGVDSECQTELDNFRKLATKMYEELERSKRANGYDSPVPNSYMSAVERFMKATKLKG